MKKQVAGSTVQLENSLPAHRGHTVCMWCKPWTAMSQCTWRQACKATCTNYPCFKFHDRIMELLDEWTRCPRIPWSGHIKLCISESLYAVLWRNAHKSFVSASMHWHHSRVYHWPELAPLSPCLDTSSKTLSLQLLLTSHTLKNISAV